jgi:hypothetical protein
MKKFEFSFVQEAIDRLVTAGFTGNKLPIGLQIIGPK